MKLLPLLALLGALTATVAAPAQTKKWQFVVLGDIPYALTDVPAFEDLIETVNGIAPAFTVHVGDTKSSTMPCGEAWSRRTLGWFNRFQSPLIYTPGDNEWTDCHRASPPSDPREELSLLRRHFFATPVSHGAIRLPLRRQSEAYPENQIWQRDGILFATTHVVGSFNNKRRDPAEYEGRNAANIAWLREAFAEARRLSARAVAVFFQADIWYRLDRGTGSSDGMDEFSQALEAETRGFGRPVLVVQGDSHVCIVEWGPPGFGADAAPIPNMLRVQVPGENTIDAVRIDVSDDPRLPFQATRIIQASRACPPPARKP